MTPHALVVGESLVDVVKTGGRTVEHPGGSAANVAVALARLGRPTRLATSFADDPHGRLIAAHLADSQVQVVGDPHVVRRTTTATVHLNAHGAATYDFDIDWRLAPVTDEDPAVVHVCSYGAVLDPGATAVVDVVRRLAGRSLVSHDINLRPDVTGAGSEVRARVLQLAGLADLVKASDEDLAALFPAGIGSGVAHLLARGAAAVVVTRGAAGAECHLADDVVQRPAPPVDVVDTIGAGDTFSAGLIDALWRRGELTGEAVRGLDSDGWGDVLDHAARVAAVTVSRPGADPPRREELTA